MIGRLDNLYEYAVVRMFLLKWLASTFYNVLNLLEINILIYLFVFLLEF